MSSLLMSALGRSKGEEGCLANVLLITPSEGIMRRGAAAYAAPLFTTLQVITESDMDVHAKPRHDPPTHAAGFWCYVCHCACRFSKKESMPSLASADLACNAITRPAHATASSYPSAPDWLDPLKDSCVQYAHLPKACG